MVIASGLSLHKQCYISLRDRYIVTLSMTRRDNQTYPVSNLRLTDDSFNYIADRISGVKRIETAGPTLIGTSPKCDPYLQATSAPHRLHRPQPNATPQQGRYEIYSRPPALPSAMYSGAPMSSLYQAGGSDHNDVIVINDGQQASHTTHPSLFESAAMLQTAASTESTHRPSFEESTLISATENSQQFSTQASPSSSLKPFEQTETPDVVVTQPRPVNAECTLPSFVPAYRPRWTRADATSIYEEPTVTTSALATANAGLVPRARESTNPSDIQVNTINAQGSSESERPKHKLPAKSLLAPKEPSVIKAGSRVAPSPAETAPTPTSSSTHCSATDTLPSHIYLLAQFLTFLIALGLNILAAFTFFTKVFVEAQKPMMRRLYVCIDPMTRAREMYAKMTLLRRVIERVDGLAGAVLQDWKEAVERVGEKNRGVGVDGI